VRPLDLDHSFGDWGRMPRNPCRWCGVAEAVALEPYPACADCWRKEPERISEQPMSAMLRRIDLSSFPIPMRLYPALRPLCFSVEVLVPHRDDGRSVGIRLDERLPPGLVDESRAIGFVLRACLRVLEHELREHFKVDGERLFDPHKGAV